VLGVQGTDQVAEKEEVTEVKLEDIAFAHAPRWPAVSLVHSAMLPCLRLADVQWRRTAP
jgi:hypothetical protein